MNMAREQDEPIWRRFGVKAQLTRHEHRRIVELLDRFGPMPLLYAITDHYRDRMHPHGCEAHAEIVEVLEAAENELRRRGF